MNENSISISRPDIRSLASRGLRAGILFMAAITVAITGSIWSGEKAHADLTDYTWEYTATNFYSENAMLYFFTGLDITFTYYWYVYKTNDSGQLIELLFTRSTIGQANYGIVLGGGGANGIWPQDYTGPIRVIDNFGQTLGRHYIAPTPVDDWITSSGVTNENLKQSPGIAVSDRDQYANDPLHYCAAPPYQPINVDGYHHTYNACSVTSGKNNGSYVLLHYRLDVADYGGGDEIVFYQLGESTPHATFSLDEIIDYNMGGVASISEVATRSFILINTGPTHLDVIDYNWSYTAFPLRSGDPHAASSDLGLLSKFDYGAYNCLRTESSTPVSDCESPLLVSRRGLVVNPFDGEWTVKINTPEVGFGGTVNVTLSQFTPEIWDSYSGAMLFFDSQYGGDVNSDLFAYSPSRILTYTADDEENAQVIGAWGIIPVAPFSFAVSALDYEFLPFDYYAIVEGAGTKGSFLSAIAAIKFDTKFGQGLLLLLAEVVIVGALGHYKAPLPAQIVALIGVGALGIMLLDMSPLFVGGFGAVTFALLLYMWQNAKRGQNDSD
jgi:hypothetical protein